MHFPLWLYSWSDLESDLALSMLEVEIVTVVVLGEADVGDGQVVNLKDGRGSSPPSPFSWIGTGEGSPGGSG